MAQDSQDDVSMDDDMSISASDSDSESQIMDGKPDEAMTDVISEPDVVVITDVPPTPSPPMGSEAGPGVGSDSDIVEVISVPPTPSSPPGCETAPDFDMQYDDPMVDCSIQPNSRLLRLPIEIFQTITWYLDAGTFFSSLLTCKRFLDAAMSKTLLLHHIQNIPGLRLGLEELETTELFEKFSMRAAESSCGANVLADVTRYAPTSKTPVTNAVFSPGR